jgi:transglutaminase-like putative cysteine protease
MKAQLFDVRHATTYEYQTPVTVAHHLLRLTPRLLVRQVRLSHAIEVEPTPAAVSRRTDYFGNEVMFLTLEGAHRRLKIVATSRVAVGPASIPDAAETPSWESVRHLCRSDRSVAVLEATEFTFRSPRIPVGPAFAGYAAPSFGPGLPILRAVMDLAERIHGDFRFDTAATTVATPLEEVLERRRGVCQDFAHLMVACLRSLGLPARYVSGYLETLPPPGQAKLVGADASHAWVAFFCPGLGWIDVDPTNNLLPSMQHITLGWGRDYADVTPLRGVLVGGDEHVLRVGVDVVAAGETDTERWPQVGVSA